MTDDNSSHLSKLILAGALGAMAGAWWKSQQIDEEKKSRVEKDNPEFLDEVCSEIDELLDDLIIDDEMVDEDDFRDTVAAYLQEESDYHIEVAPHTQFGKPDILIEATLALEAKYNPSKAEMDRCIGQWAGYSREWETWILLYSTPPSRAQYLRDVLDSKGFDNIPIVSFQKRNGNGDE